MTTTTIARAPAKLTETTPATSITETETTSTSLATTTTVDAAAALAVRRAGWRVLHDLHTASDTLNAAIVATARQSGASVRIVGLSEQGQDKAWAQRQAEALDALPALLAGLRSITEHLARPDCIADPARGDIIVNAEALAALGDADVALDDALTLAALARPSTSSAARRTGRDTWSRSPAEAEAEYAQALAVVSEAQTQALDALTRAEALERDLALLPSLLGALRTSCALPAEQQRQDRR